MYFFENPEHVVMLSAALQRWEGTRFIQGHAVAGVGVDCVHFVREVLRDCGVDVAPAEQIPAYSLRWGHHGDSSHLLGWLRGNAQARSRLESLDVASSPLPGDLVLLRRTRLHHHLGILDAAEPPTIWHVDYPGGVARIAFGAASTRLHPLRYRLIS